MPSILLICKKKFYSSLSFSFNQLHYTISNTSHFTGWAAHFCSCSKRPENQRGWKENWHPQQIEDLIQFMEHEKTYDTYTYTPNSLFCGWCLIPICFKPSNFFCFGKKTHNLEVFCLPKTKKTTMGAAGSSDQTDQTDIHRPRRSPRGVDLRRFGSFEERLEAFPSSTLPEPAERASTVASFQVDKPNVGGGGKCANPEDAGY